MIENHNFIPRDLYADKTSCLPYQPTHFRGDSEEDDKGMKLTAEVFLEEHYLFRRNALNGLMEYKEAGKDDASYHRLTQESLNTIILHAKRELPMEKCLRGDIKTYVESNIPPLYNPIHEWLHSLPTWDGSDHVGALLHRIPGLSDNRLSLMRIWLRSVVAHWLNLDMEHGNETVPLFIGSQGCGKSTFCIRLLPPELRHYYLDHFNLSNKFDKDTALCQSLLICLDEFDQYTSSQMAKLKQVLSKVKVNARAIFGKTIDDHQRFASFIATTNNRHPLVDHTGSRRYLTIEIAQGKMIDNDSAIDYSQLYAQLRHEVCTLQLRHWFTNEETSLIQSLNAPYEHTLDLEQIISTLFRKPHTNETCGSFTSLDIRKVLKAEYPDVTDSQLSSVKIGLAMREMKVARVRSKRGAAYSLVRKE